MNPQSAKNLLFIVLLLKAHVYGCRLVVKVYVSASDSNKYYYYYYYCIFWSFVITLIKKIRYQLLKAHAIMSLDMHSKIFVSFIANWLSHNIVAITPLKNFWLKKVAKDFLLNFEAFFSLLGHSILKKSKTFAICWGIWFLNPQAFPYLLGFLNSINMNRKTCLHSLKTKLKTCWSVARNVSSRGVSRLNCKYWWLT